MEVGRLRIYLIRIEFIVNETIMIYVSPTIERAQEEALPHATRCQALLRHVEHVGWLRYQGRTCTVSHHLEDEAKTVVIC